MNITFMETRSTQYSHSAFLSDSLHTGHTGGLYYHNNKRLGNTDSMPASTVLVLYLTVSGTCRNNLKKKKSNKKMHNLILAGQTVTYDYHG